MTESHEHSDLARLDGGAMLLLLESGEVSALELTAHHLARLEERGGELNAVVSVDGEGARATAAGIDRRRRQGEPLGALAGLPMTVKDSFDVAGLRTSHGRLADSHVATTDAPVVGRVRRADAVVLGKTNVPLLLDDYQTANDDFGRTNSPWHPDRIPGGSSGGSAAAVSAGLSHADIGSDLSGSIRMPAAWCGLFGHRPSNGIVSKMGHLPWPVDGLIEPPLSVTGPLARSAADVVRLMDVMIGPAGLDTTAWRVVLPPSRLSGLRGARVGVWSNEPGAPVDGEMRTALARFVEVLEHAGCIVGELGDTPVSGPGALELFDRLSASEISHSIGDADWAALRTDPGSAGSGLLQHRRDSWLDLEEQQRITRRWNDVFERFDVVVAPAVQGAAPLFSGEPKAGRTILVDGQEHSAMDVVSAWSRLANLGRLPATVVPIGLGDESGMPIGVQIIGAFLEDRTPLEFARLLEEEGAVGFVPPPGW